MRIVFSGGGTGGHVYPAIAIADALKKINTDAEIFFIGAKDKLEMEKVPQAGYPIEGLWISGFHRKLTWKNLIFPIKLIHSLIRARKLLKEIKPQVVVGVGGFASGPTLEMACRLGIPTLIQEQNSYPGITNRILAHKVNKICVAYENMEKYFQKEKIIMTGNPVRKEIFIKVVLKEQHYQYFDLVRNKKTLLLFGGSLGARSLNLAVAQNFETLKERQDVQLIWQVGKLYYNEYKNSRVAQLSNVVVRPYIEKMDIAYALADLVICRAGALTISELCAAGKAAILIPSPNVAEDHQTKNAKALTDRKAALMIRDEDTSDLAFKEALRLLDSPTELQSLCSEITKMSVPKSDEKIAQEIIKLISNKSKIEN